MIDRFKKPACNVIKSLQESIVCAGTLSMTYNVFASGSECKNIHDKPCFARIDRNSAVIALSVMTAYPFGVSILNPLLYLGAKKCLEGLYDYGYKLHRELISVFFSALFKGTFYFMFLMYAAGQLGAPVVENWVAGISGFGCFVLAVLSDPTVQERISCWSSLEEDMFKKILVGIKDFVFSATNVFTITHGNFSAIQNSLMVATGDSDHADLYRIIRLSAAGALGIFFGSIVSILPSLRNNKLEDMSIPKKMLTNILEAGNYLFSPFLLLSLFYMEIMTSILPTGDWMKVLYPLLAAATVVVLGYAIGRQCFTEDQKCCLEQYIEEDFDELSSEEDNIQELKNDETKSLPLYRPADYKTCGTTKTVINVEKEHTITDLLYGLRDNTRTHPYHPGAIVPYSPGFFSHDVSSSTAEASQQNIPSTIRLSFPSPGD